MNAPDLFTIDPEGATPATAVAPIATAAARLEAWRLACVASTSADNLVKVDGVVYAIDPPRWQKNGAAIGRVHAQRSGELFRDAGHYKVDASGRVLEIPAELASALPCEEGAP